MDENLGSGVADRQGTDTVSRPVDQERSVSPDRILSAVGNEQRRAILRSLNSASDGILEYDALVEQVAERVRDDDTERGSDEHRERIRIGLHHTHLPKLKDVRIIDYEADAGHVQFVGGELERDLLALTESYDVSN